MPAKGDHGNASAFAEETSIFGCSNKEAILL